MIGFHVRLLEKENVMKRTTGLSLALVALACLWLAPAAQANHINAEDIAKHCANAVNRLADRCASVNERTAAYCVKRIERLLENGHRDAAHRVARRCVRLINRRSNACVEHIRIICRECIYVLKVLGHPELADRLEGICAENVKKVRRSQADAILKVRHALPNIDVAPVAAIAPVIAG